MYLMRGESITFLKENGFVGHGSRDFLPGKVYITVLRSYLDHLAYFMMVDYLHVGYRLLRELLRSLMRNTVGCLVADVH